MFIVIRPFRLCTTQALEDTHSRTVRRLDVAVTFCLETMAENHDTSPLPPGWDRKYDHRTGKHYYINYFNKTTTWEDPRFRYRQLQATPQYNMSGTQVIESIPLQDMTNVRPSPIPGRAFSHIGAQVMNNQFGSPRSPARFVESSFVTDPEQSVSKISAMFPTVAENHIKALLIKYLKSVFPKADETLLLDALNNSDNNVQKASEMMTTMGFEKRDTPPPRLTLRKKEEEAKALREKLLATPIPPPRMKSHEEKQKMKSRLQEQYVDIPERVVTIALESVDYDEERAAQILQIMVQEDVKPKPAVEEVTSVRDKETSSLNTIVVQDKSAQEVESAPVGDCSEVAHVSPTEVETLDHSEKLHKRQKGKKDIPKVSRGTSTTEDKEYKSPYLLKVCGPTTELCKGPNDELLLSDYITWNGPNPDFLSKPKTSLAKGPNKSILKNLSSCFPKGPNMAFWKGPKKGLAKGSIYSQMNAKNAANESRGK